MRNNFEFGPVVHEIFRLKIFHIYSSGRPSSLVEQNHLGNFDSGHYEEHFFENNFNIKPAVLGIEKVGAILEMGCQSSVRLS